MFFGWLRIFSCVEECFSGFKEFDSELYTQLKRLQRHIQLVILRLLLFLSFKLCRSTHLRLTLPGDSRDKIGVEAK